MVCSDNGGRRLRGTVFGARAQTTQSDGCRGRDAGIAEARMAEEMVFSDVEDKIRFCFDGPKTAPREHRRGGVTSVLYLLRRELVETAGYNPDTVDEAAVERSGVRNRLFASLILMFTGFDLLAKLQRGDKEDIGVRFRAFVGAAKGGAMTAQDAHLFYAIRNSLVHAFGVPNQAKLSRLGLTDLQLAQRQVWPESGGETGLLIVSHTPPVATLYIDGVYAALLRSIARVEDSLYGADSAAARGQFEQMFDEYGSIGWS